MTNNRTRLMLLMTMLVILAAPIAFAQQRAYESDRQPEQYFDADRSRSDRYLDVEVWPTQGDGDYYIGDEVSFRFRANRDCFVAIYSIDSRGKVNLLFPTEPGEDNFVIGGEMYRLP
ncbi:MAG: DUF4384 domain-containing protein, partial [candidate division Zixibacteria bacterium]